MNINEKLALAPVVSVRITKACQFGKPGDVMEFSRSKANQLVESGCGKIIDEPKTKDAARPAKARPLISNKSLGA